MTGDTIAIVLIFGIVIFLLLIIFNFVNLLLFYKKRVISKFDSVWNLINARVVILEKLSEFLKSNYPHEDNIINKLESVVGEIKNSSSINDVILSLEKSLTVQNKVTNLENDIKNNNKISKDYLTLQKDLADNLGRIIFSSSVYNLALNDYNNYKNNKLLKYLSKFFKFPDFKYLQIK